MEIEFTPSTESMLRRLVEAQIMKQIPRIGVKLADTDGGIEACENVKDIEQLRRDSMQCEIALALAIQNYLNRDKLK